MADVSRLAQVRARLDLPVVRRAAGLLEGRHRSVHKGHGQDFDDLHLYAPGEDVGDIDWKSSARAGIPVVRRFVRESNVNVVLVVDTGRPMGATAPSGEPKAEVASLCCALVAYLARDRGDRVALVAGDARRVVQLPPRASTRDLEVLLRTVDGLWRPDAPASDLARPLDRALTAFRRRSLVVVVTDEARPDADHDVLLRALRVRHEVLVVRVADLSPVALDGTGTGAGAAHREIEDVDGGLRLPAFLRGRAGLAQAAADTVSRRRAEVAQRLAGLRVDSVLVGGTDDVVPGMVGLLGRRARAGR